MTYIFLPVDIEIVFGGYTELSQAEVVVHVVRPSRPHLFGNGDVGDAAHVQLHVQDRVSR